MGSKREISKAAALRIVRASDNQNHGRGIGTPGRNPVAVADAQVLIERADVIELRARNSFQELWVMRHGIGTTVLYVAPGVRVEDEIASAAIESGEIRLSSVWV